MSRPPRPVLAEADDLTAAVDIDISGAIEALVEQRTQSPIVRPSKAADVAALVDASFPGGGEPLPQLVEQITRANNAYPRRNTHPGFFGWVAPSGLPSDPLAFAMVGAINENVGGYWSSPLATTIERILVRWLADLAGMPAQSEGLLLSGGSIANMTGIASALARRLGPDYRTRGLAGTGAAAPVILCSSATHFSVRRAAVLLGLGSDSVVAVATDDEFRMSLPALERALEQNASAVCVVANAGTTNTGAIDPMADIAGLCAKHDVWLHVDAALGGGGLMSPQLRPRYAGIDRADSVTMDLHKWFFQALDGSMLLYRDASWARQLFADSDAYLQADRNEAPETYKFYYLAPELSRRFRALPVYLALRHYGIPRLGRNVLHNVECAEYLAALIEAEEELELVVAPQLSILCFRYRPPQRGDAEIDRINTEIRDRIQLEGDYLISPTQVEQRPVLRVCIMNHATRAAHVEGLLASVLRIGRELS